MTYSDSWLNPKVLMSQQNMYWQHSLDQNSASTSLCIVIIAHFFHSTLAKVQPLNTHCCKDIWNRSNCSLPSQVSTVSTTPPLLFYPQTCTGCVRWRKDNRIVHRFVCKNMWWYMCRTNESPNDTQITCKPDSMMLKYQKKTVVSPSTHHAGTW